MEHFQRKAGPSYKQLHRNKKEDFKNKTTNNLTKSLRIPITNTIENLINKYRNNLES